jgi:hypothetical protein
LAKDASANLSIFLALSEPAKFGTTSLCRTSPFLNGLVRDHFSVTEQHGNRAKGPFPDGH